MRWRLRRPFVTALGVKTHSDNVLVELELSGGHRGLGEASSSLAMPEQTGPGLAAALRRLGRRFISRDARDAEGLVSEARRAEPGWSAAVGAFEAALWDALARTEGIPFWRLWGEARSDLETTRTLSALSPEEMGRSARSAVRAGWRVLKLKINGREPTFLNRDRVRAVRRAAPRARLLWDPNQSFSVERLEELVQAVAKEGELPELIEEPFPRGDWASLRRASGPVPMILDESVRAPEDVRPAASARRVKGANLKLAKSGLCGSRDILAAFRAKLGRRAVFMVGCMAESRAGLAAAAQFAMGTGAFAYADLDSDLMLEPAGIRGGYRREGAWIVLPRRPGPGLGLSRF